MTTSNSLDFASTFVRLRPDTSVETLNVDAGFWPRLAAGELGSFHNEYLVACFDFSADWSIWEMHPHGDEIVCLLSGSVTFVLEREGGCEMVELKESGNYVVVPKGVWHTAKPHGSVRMLFITAGKGTQHRAVTA